MTRSRGTYPLPPPPSGDDARFTVGLLLDTADLLTAVGYPQLAGPDLVELQQALFRFLYAHPCRLLRGGGRA